MNIFEQWKFDDAHKIIKPLGDDAGIIANKAFRAGDHWQNDKAWIGEKPAGKGKGSTDALKLVEAGLVSKNVIGEVCQRRKDAFIGKEPSSGITVRRPLGKVAKVGADGQEERDSKGNPVMVDEQSNDNEQAEISIGEAGYTSWWDSVEALRTLQDSAVDLCDGRALVRLFVPPGLRVDGQIPQVAFDEAFDYIYLDTPSSTQATVYTDPDTQRKASIYFYDYQPQGQDKTFKRIEVSYIVDEGENKGKTAIRILTQEGDEQFSEPYFLDLGGRLVMYEMKDAPLITPQVRQNQSFLNIARTMELRNVQFAGWLEGIYMNAQPPGHWAVKDGKNVFVEDEDLVGVAVRKYLSGLVVTDKAGNPILDNNGRPTIADPQVFFRDPVDVETFERTAESAYRSILEETHQLHAMLSGDAVASGESRKQAMEDFRKSLKSPASQMNACGRWLIETVLAMASQFSGQPGRFKDYRATFDCQIDVGELSSDQKSAMLNEVKEKLRSRENYMVTTGVTEDPDAELAQIRSEDEQLNPVQSNQAKRTALQLAEEEKRISVGESNSAAAIRDRLAGAQDATGVTQ